MSSLPREARVAMAVCGIAAGVIAIVVLIVAGVMSFSSGNKPEPADSAYESTTTTVGPEPEAEPTQPPSTGSAPVEVAVEADQGAPPQEPSGAESSEGSSQGSSTKPSSSSKSKSSPGSISKSGSSGCPAVGCNGGRGDNYTADIDAPQGKHTVGSGPGGTATNVPDKPGEVVQMNH